MTPRLSIAMTALVLFGCSSSPMKPGPMSPEAPFVEVKDQAPPKVGETHGFTSERTPAQASSIRWVEDSRAVTVTPGGGSSNIMLSPRQIETYQEPYRYTCDMYTWGTTTCEDWVCTGGTGKSELWNAYYSAPREQKAAALDRALLGIGSSTARRLHESGIFNTKARSWQEFRDRMNQALRRGVITGDQYREVFGTYGQQNRINLGYAGDTCRSQYYRCETWGIFSVPDGCSGMRQMERTINVVNRQVQLNVSNPQLQSFESESVTISSGPDFDSVRVSGSDKTQYRLVSRNAMGNDGVSLSIEGVGRNQVALPGSVLQKFELNDSRGNNMNAVITVDPTYIGEGEDKLMVKLQVSHCKPGGFWSLGDCAGNDANSKVTLPAVFQTIKQAKSSFALPEIPSGNAVWISYSLHRENSRWYNNSPVAVRDNMKLKEYKK